MLEALADGDLAPQAVTERLADRFPQTMVRETLEELLAAQAIRTVEAPVPAPRPEGPRRRIPLTTLVMNVTSKCNLSCKYCYEYGEDRLSEPATKPRFMSEETARQSVDFMFAESGTQPHVHLTFFGGETLHYFSLALTIGILFGIYSSVLVMAPLVRWLGVSREDLVKPEKKAMTGEKILP